MTDPTDQDPVAPPPALVPPTPVAVSSQDDVEYPFGWRYTLAQWRHAVQYRVLSGRSRYYLLISLFYSSLPLSFGMLFWHHLADSPLLVVLCLVAGMGTTIGNLALIVLPIPLKPLLALINLFGTGFLLISISGILFLFPLQSAGFALQFNCALYGLALTAYAVELLLAYRKLKPPAPPPVELEQKLDSYLKAVKAARPGECDQIIEFNAGTWFTPLAWRALMFDDYAVILCLHTGASFFVRREELSIAPVSDVGVVMRCNVIITIASEKPMNGTIDPREFQTYREWLQGRPEAAAQESPA